MLIATQAAVSGLPRNITDQKPKSSEINMSFFIAQLISALSFAAVLYLLSCGLSLIQGVMKIVNVAHGSFFMLGAYVGMSVMSWSNSFFLAVLSGSVTIAILGLVVDRLFLQWVSKRILHQLLITIGFLLIFQDLVFLFWGGDPYSIAVPSFFTKSIHIADIQFSAYRIYIFLVATVVAATQWLFIEKTILGAKLRATIDDSQMAGGVGINTALVSASMFSLGAALTGFGGVMAAPFFGVYNTMDMEFLPFAFVVVIIGGEGSLKGAAIASLIVGLTDTFGKAFFPELAYFTLFAPMAIIVALRPQGLFGR